MKTLAHLLLFALALSTFSCAEDSKKTLSGDKPAPTVSGSSSDTPTGEMPDCFLYTANVDKLLIREEPTQKSVKILGKVAKGSLLEGSGEASGNKEMAVLSGREVESVFYKINVPGAEARQGWVFGGALLPIYAGRKNAAPDQARLAQLSKTLASYKITQLASGQKAWDYVSKNYSDVSGSLADAVFSLLEQHLNTMVFEGNFYTLTEREQWADADYEQIHKGSFDMNSRPLTKQLAAAGMSLGSAEGMIFPTIDYKRLQSFFGNKLTAPMREYLQQITHEALEPMYDDGGIVIPLEEVANRAIFWEHFNKKYPYFLRKEETGHYEHWMSTALLCGADNTPIFNYETKAILDDYKNVWTSVIGKYPGSKLAADTKTFTDLCTAEGWKVSPKVEAWMQARNQLQ